MTCTRKPDPEGKRLAALQAALDSIKDIPAPPPLPKRSGALGRDPQMLNSFGTFTSMERLK